MDGTLPGVFDMLQYFKRFGFQWKAFDLLLKQDEVYFVGDGAVVGL